MPSLVIVHTPATFCVTSAFCPRHLSLTGPPLDVELQANDSYERANHRSTFPNERLETTP